LSVCLLLAADCASLTFFRAAAFCRSLAISQEEIVSRSSPTWLISIPFESRALLCVFYPRRLERKT
jgi:hypothetical protein